MLPVRETASKSRRLALEMLKKRHSLAFDLMHVVGSQRISSVVEELSNEKKPHKKASQESLTKKTYERKTYKYMRN